MYRQDVPEETHPPGTANSPDEPQFQGVQFDDGTVVIRWMTEFKSTTYWDNMAAMLAVHGHPEFGSVLVWHAEKVDHDVVVATLWEAAQQVASQNTPKKDV